MKAAAIAAAIELSNPGLDAATRDTYAAAVLDAAKASGADPAAIVALVHNESRWRASAVGGMDGQCVGFGQVCLHNFAVCRTPEGFAAQACQAHKARLLNGTANLRAMGEAIGRWRTWCKKKVGKATTAHWLFAYGGWNSPKAGLWCGRKHTRGTWRDVARPKTVKRIVARATALKTGR